MRNERVKVKRLITEENIVDMLKREDYYMILKIRRNPEDRQQIRWNVMRTRWSILNQNNKL